MICIEDYKNKEEIVMLLCNHYLHKKCLIKWLQRKRECPMCRQEI